MKRCLVALYCFALSCWASAQPLCVVWRGEPPDKCDQQKAAKPAAPALPAPASNSLGVEWAGKPMPAPTAPQTGIHRPPDNGLAGGGTAAARPAGDHSLGVEWAGGNKNPVRPKPAGANTLDMEWASGGKAAAPAQPATGGELGVHWAGSAKPAAPVTSPGNALGIGWAGRQGAGQQPTRGSGLDVGWVGASKAVPGTQADAGQEKTVAGSAATSPGGQNNGLDTVPTAGNQQPACSAAEFDRKLAANRGDYDYVSQQVNYYTTMMQNAIRNGFSCTDCNAKLIALSGDIGRIQRERDQLLRLKSQCIAVNSAAQQSNH
jgi:hypothetical protein